MIGKSELLRRMSVDLAMLPTHLAKIIQTAPLRYKVFNIPKKSGGVREVAQPAREVKAIQRWILKEFAQHFPVHSCATAYQSGSSIKQNAEQHAMSRYMLKLDFSGFFPSIMRSDIELHLLRHCSTIFDNEAQRLLAHVCCWAPDRRPPLRLCIGAPSSPLLSNSVMFEFDEELTKACLQDGAVYTRYADDLTISSKERGVIDKYEQIVASLLVNINYPKLSLNKNKTIRASRAGLRTVTGLVLTPDGKISIGRDRKRLIRSMYYRKTQGLLSESEIEALNGLLAFADGIEPGFSLKLALGISRKL